MIDIVIFDFDGVISDSFSSQFEFFKHLGKKLSKKFDYSNVEEFREAWREPVYPDLYKFLGYDWDKEKEIIWQEYNKIMADGVHPLHNGIEDALKVPYVKNKKMAIASSNTNQAISKQLKDHKLEYYFDLVVGKEDLPVENGLPKLKPQPHSLLRVLERTGFFPREAVYVGDQPSDIHAARNVSLYAKEPIKVIAVTYGFASREKLEEQKPEYIVDSAEELNALFKSIL